MRTFWQRLNSSALLLALGAVGCAPYFDGALFRKSEVEYRVGSLEPGFARVDVQGNDLAFYKRDAGTIAVNATCREYDDVPQAALLNHLLFGTSNRQYLVDEEVVLDGRGARHAVVEAELDGIPVRVEIYLLTRSGCVFDLSYISDRGAPAAPAFGRFARDFRVLAVRS